MNKAAGISIGLLAITTAFTGCSSDPEPADPTPFCDTVQAFQEASIAAANAAIGGGDAAAGDLQKDLEPSVVPLERLQSTLPTDAPADVQKAVSTYLRGLQYQAGSSDSTSDAEDPATDALEPEDPATDALEPEDPATDALEPEDPTATDETAVTEEETTTSDETVIEQEETETVISDDELQTAAKVLEGYLDEECPHTLPTEGS